MGIQGLGGYLEHNNMTKIFAPNIINTSFKFIYFDFQSMIYTIFLFIENIVNFMYNIIKALELTNVEYLDDELFPDPTIVLSDDKKKEFRQNAEDMRDNKLRLLFSIINKLTVIFNGTIIGDKLFKFTVYINYIVLYKNI